MAVQQNKVSKSRRDKRRAHDALRTVNSVECAECGEPKRFHHVCGACGTYRDMEVVPKFDQMELDEDLA
ncbi:MAG: 50S ribosomal protein L32 [Aestuariivita sp.]|nr:50S ribosomal protein L32 [Aestuariivita sp.]